MLYEFVILEANEICKMRDSLGIKRDLLKRKKEVAIYENVLIYSKSRTVVDLTPKESIELASQAMNNYELSKSAFNITGDKPLRVILLEK